MLRFGTSATDCKPRTVRRERMRLWLLFGAACVVMFSIRVLTDPQTARQVDSAFLPSETSAKSLASAADPVAGDARNAEFESGSLLAEVRAPADHRVSLDKNRFDLSSVRDNTYFRPEESDAWFAVFDWLKKNPEPLRDQSATDVSYAQFIDQPQVYRGQLVSVTGTIEREELLVAPANDIGIEQYHRLILRPKGGGVWPIVVYALKLPLSFPRDENVALEATVTGIFFKNWSYSWRGGLGLAPVVLANTIDWQPTITLKRRPTEVSAFGLIVAAAAAGVIATFIGWLAWQHTRRSSGVWPGHSVVIAPPPDEN